MRTPTLGIGLPVLGEGGTSGGIDVTSAARRAEALGLDSVWAADLILGDGTPGLEAVVALTAAAAVTERIGLGFGVLSLPLRPVAWVAAQVQALQHLSRNRVRLGVGSGGMPGSPFWRAVGVPARERGRRTDAALAALAGLIAGEPTRLGQRPEEVEITLAPRAPVPPILVGGNSDAAINRAAHYGDGWLPSQIGPRTLAAGVAKLRRRAAEHQRPAPAVYVGGLVIHTDDASVRAARAAHESFARNLPGEHGITVEEAAGTVTGSPAEAAERIAEYVSAGADGVIVSPDVDSAGAQWLRQCELVAETRSLLA